VAAANNCVRERERERERERVSGPKGMVREERREEKGGRGLH